MYTRDTESAHRHCIDAIAFISIRIVVPRTATACATNSICCFLREGEKENTLMQTRLEPRMDLWRTQHKSGIDLMSHGADARRRPTDSTPALRTTSQFSGRVPFVKNYIRVTWRNGLLCNYEMILNGLSVPVSGRI